MKIKGSKNKIVCEGNLIFDNAEEVKDALLEKLEKINFSKPVSIDLSNIYEVDSSGLQLLLAFFRTLDNKETTFKVVGISDQMMDMLTLSGLNKYFRLEV
jgi:anti-anti-sigma factor